MNLGENCHPVAPEPVTGPLPQAEALRGAHRLFDGVLVVRLVCVVQNNQPPGVGGTKDLWQQGLADGERYVMEYEVESPRPIPLV